MKQFKICCDDLKNNLYEPDGKTWGIGLSQYVGSAIRNWTPRPDKICVLFNGLCPLFDIQHCPYCGKQLQLVESKCNHDLEEDE